MTRLYVEFDRAEKQEEGVLNGTILQYDDTGRQRNWDGFERRYRVLPDGLTLADPVIVNMQHNDSRAIASTASPYAAIHRLPDRLTMTLRYPDSPRGIEARNGVEAGIFTGLSAELDMGVTRVDGDLTIIEKALLSGVALVTRPAFRKSRFFGDIPVEFVDVGLPLRFADVLRGVMAWGTIGVVSATRRRAVMFEKNSLIIEDGIAFTHGSSLDNVLGSNINGALEVKATEEGIEFVVKRVALTGVGKDLKTLIKERLITGFSIGFQRRESEMRTVEIEGVPYDLEVVKKACISEIRTSSSMTGGMGDVEVPRPARRRRRR